MRAGSPPLLPPQRLPLVVDDVGLPWVDPVRRDAALSTRGLRNLLRLAREFDLAIPIGVTAGYLDVDGLSGAVEVHPEAEAILELLRAHPEHLPVWNHGLTHRFGDRPTEFCVYDSERRVPASVQRDHLATSQAILEHLGLGRPTVFVPPALGWEPGVTDRIAASLGFEAIAMRSALKSPFRAWVTRQAPRFRRRWPPPEGLVALHRLGLGLPADQTLLSRPDVWRVRQFVAPFGPLVRFALHRTWHPTRPHHFAAHIQNFERDDSLPWWRQILQFLTDRVGPDA